MVQRGRDSGNSAGKHGGVQNPGGAAVAIARSLQARCRPTEPGDRMAAMRVGKHQIGKVANNDSNRERRPQRSHR